MAITLASVANVHLEFNKIEEKYQKRGITQSRANLAKGAYWLIGLFLLAVVLVTLKPILCGGETAQAIINMAAITIVLWHVLILISLTQFVFAIEPEIKPPKEICITTIAPERCTKKETVNSSSKSSSYAGAEHFRHVNL